MSMGWSRGYHCGMAKTSSELTSKQRKFCRLVAEGTMSNAEAYRTAYDCSGSKKTQVESASRLVADPKVSAMIRRLIDARDRAVQDRALSQRDLVMDRLRQAIDDDDFGSNRLRALDLMATVAGMKKHSIDVSTEDRSSSAIAADLEAKLTALGLYDDAIDHGETIDHDDVVDHDDAVNTRH